MHEIYFLARHTPFWAIPIAILSVEFGYLFWLRKKKRAAFIYFMLFIICMSSSGFYFWAGGPENSVRIIKKFYRNHTN
jgi:hypothetical protein